MKSAKVYTTNDFLIWLLTFLLFFVSVALAAESRGFYVLSGVTIGVLMLSNYKLTIGPFHKYVFRFFFFCLLSVFWAWNYHYTVERSLTILEILICVSVLYDYYLKFDSIDILLNIIIITGYAIIIYAFFYYGLDIIMLSAQEQFRLSNEFNNVNVFCQISAMSVIVDVYYCLYKKFRWSLLMAIPTILMISLTQSRKALFMVFFAPTLLYFYKNSKNITKDLRPMMKIIGYLLIAGFIVSMFSDTIFFSGIAKRVESLLRGLTGSDETDHSTMFRLQMIEIGWKQFKETPLLGIGIGNSIVLLSQEMGMATYLHNNFIELLACGGIVGFLLYYSIYWYLLVNLFKYRKYSTYSMLFIVLVLTKLFTDYGAVSYYSKPTYFYIMVFFIYVEHCKMASRKRYKKTNISKETSSEVTQTTLATQ